MNKPLTARDIMRSELPEVPRLGWNDQVAYDLLSENPYNLPEEQFLVALDNTIDRCDGDELVSPDFDRVRDREERYIALGRRHRNDVYPRQMIELHDDTPCGYTLIRIDAADLEVHRRQEQEQELLEGDRWTRNAYWRNHYYVAYSDLNDHMQYAVLHERDMDANPDTCYENEDPSWRMEWALMQAQPDELTIDQCTISWCKWSHHLFWDEFTHAEHE